MDPSLASHNYLSRPPWNCVVETSRVKFRAVWLEGAEPGVWWGLESVARGAQQQARGVQGRAGQGRAGTHSHAHTFGYTQTSWRVGLAAWRATTMTLSVSAIDGGTVVLYFTWASRLVSVAILLPLALIGLLDFAGYAVFRTLGE